MSTTQGDADKTADILHEITAPQRDLITTLREMETNFRQEREFILQHHPEEDVGEFPSLNDIETTNYRDLDVRKVFCELALRHIGRRANEVQAELDEAERKQREQNLTEMEMLKRAVYHLAARVAKLEGERSGRLPGLPHVARSEVPQYLGMGAGMGRHGVANPAGVSGGVRKLASGSPVPDAPIESGVTRRQNALEVIGSSGRR
jgi:hypothetical protein